MQIERRVTSGEEARNIAKQESLQFLGIRWLNDIGIAYYNPTPAIAKPGVSFEEALEVLEYETLLNYWWMFFDALAAAKYRYPYKEHICDYSPGTGTVCLKSEEVPRGETRWVSSIAAIAYGCAPDSIELTVEYLANVLGIVRKVSPGQDVDVAMLGSRILTEGMYAKACFANVSGCEKICLVLNGGLAQGFDPAFILSGIPPIVVAEEEEVWVNYLYVLLFTLHVIVLHNMDGTYTGTSYALTAANTRPSGITTDGTYLYVVDWLADSIFLYGMDGTYTGTSYALTAANTDSSGITTDDTYLYVVDWLVMRIFLYTMDGSYTGTSYALTATNTGSEGITTDGTYLYVVDTDTVSIFLYNMDGTYTGTSYALTAANVRPGGITTDGTYLYVVDITEGTIFLYNMDGTYTGTIYEVGGDPVGVTTKLREARG